MNSKSLCLSALTLSLGACASNASKTTPAASSYDPVEAGAPVTDAFANDAAVTSNAPSLDTSVPPDTETSEVSTRTRSVSTGWLSASADTVSDPKDTSESTSDTTAGTTSDGDFKPTPAPWTPIGSRNFVCEPSPSPMFQGQEVLEMHIAADFSAINSNDRESANSAGWLDPDGTGPLEPIAVEVHARGVSRFQHCGYRPFKVKFAEKQKGNVFQKLGKSVKFSTHCGDRDGMASTLRAPSLEEYYQRVRMEHLVYQLLLPLETMSLATRLVRLTYEDTSTGQSETHLAFVREPEDELGQRCGMLEGEDIPDEPTTLNERANLLLNLLNFFVLQSDDDKNRFDLVDPERHLRAPVPYDYDFVGIFRRDYPGLKGRTLADNAKAFADWLRRNQSPELHEEVTLLLSKADEMRRIIADAELTPSNRELFDEWLSVLRGVLQAFDACKTAGNDPQLSACYIADDHSDTIADATTMALGEHSLMLEPPGDRDVVLVTLEPERLYTVATPVYVTWRSPDGEVIGSIDQHRDDMTTALSLRTSAGGTYSVEFDLGSTLVCSDMWNNAPEMLAHPYAVYEDDHGGTVSTATVLGPNTTILGRFELNPQRGLFDEDWFTVSVSPNARVFFESEDADWPFIEIRSTSDLGAIVETYYVEGGREDLTSLFPSGGEYLLRVVQGFKPAAYSLQVSEDGE